nr:integrase, catalytic region, zinc finger, CCHC-type, peptidase aspartic, catalytic [Tanacetum cinerariifolium]
MSLEGNKSWESNIGDSDNTRDGGKIASRVIITWGGGMVSYACMTSIFESSCKGKKTSMFQRYLVNLFEESGEMLPVPAVAATDDSLAVLEHTTVETPLNMSPKNKAHYESEKEAIHSILSGIRDEIYSTISVYYVEGLGHNLFSVRQFCDSDLVVAFRKHSCYVRDTDGVDLLKGSRGANLYTISVEDMMKSSPI